MVQQVARPDIVINTKHSRTGESSHMYRVEAQSMVWYDLLITHIEFGSGV